MIEVVEVIWKHIGTQPSPYVCQQAYFACMSQCNDEITSKLKLKHDALAALEYPKETDWVLLMTTFAVHD
jgi:hypothetical protein